MTFCNFGMRLAGSMFAFISSFALAQQPLVTEGPLVREGVTQQISKHAYVIPDGGVPAVPNIGIVVGTRAILVIDTGLGNQNGAAVLREASKLNATLPLYLVTTHVHPEHDLGAHAFPSTTKLIRAQAQVQEIADAGMTTAEVFRRRSPAMAQLLAGATFRAADITFDKEYRLDLGGVHARLIAMGTNHTPGDTVTFVEEDGVLFSGDVAMPALPSFVSRQSSLKQWLLSLDRLDALKPIHVVPSHGVVGDAKLIDNYRQYLLTVRDRTTALKREGKTVEQVTEVLNAEFKSHYSDTSRVAGAVRAAYAEAR